jgi:hypothetical protein
MTGRASLLAGLLLLLAGISLPARAADDLVTVGDVAYILTTAGTSRPTHAVILMPGGSGQLNPRLQNGKLAFGFAGNFLIRSRGLFADQQFVAASTNATTSPQHMRAITGDLERRYGKLAVYIVGTSRSTESTMALAGPLDGEVAGFVHTSSMNAIAGFDTRRFKSRHLIVYHRMDACRVTNPSSSASAHNKYGTDVIEMDGGKSTGDDCQALSHHGYNGIEKETVARIKEWIQRAR